MKEYYKEIIDWSMVKKYDPIEIDFKCDKSLVYFISKDLDIIRFKQTSTANSEGIDVKFCRPLDKAYIKREIDWSKVPVDTKCIDLISDQKNHFHFSGYYPDTKRVHLFKDGRTSWTNGGLSTYWVLENEVQLVE